MWGGFCRGDDEAAEASAAAVICCGSGYIYDDEKQILLKSVIDMFFFFFFRRQGLFSLFVIAAGSGAAGFGGYDRAVLCGMTWRVGRSKCRCSLLLWRLVRFPDLKEQRPHGRGWSRSGHEAAA